MTVRPDEEPCIFCRRVAGDDHWVELFRTEHSIAALANHQRTPGSIIFIPRRHEIALNRLTAAESTDLYRTITTVSAAIRAAAAPDAVYLWQGGRIPLPHIHARLSPRRHGQDYTFVPNDQLALTPLRRRLQIADQIRRHLPPTIDAVPPMPSLDIDDRLPCPVCNLVGSQPIDVIVAERGTAVAYVPSRQPERGTALVVTRRHVVDPHELSGTEAADLWELMRTSVGAVLAASGAPSYHTSQYLGRLTGEPLSHLYWRIEPTLTGDV